MRIPAGWACSYDHHYDYDHHDYDHHHNDGCANDHDLSGARQPR